MTTKTESGTIRRDLFAVKADQRDFAGWCVVAIFRNRRDAHARAKEIRADHSIGLNRLAKVVHPAQWVVDGFLAYGNDIR